MSRTLIAVICATMCLSASAGAQNLDFGIEDDASYQQFKTAISKTQYVRLDYALQEKPRAAAAIAGLLVFATNNPQASQADLQNFLNTYDQALWSYPIVGMANSDPDLVRNSNLLAAIRRNSRFDDPVLFPELAGFDSRVGDEVLGLLNMDVRHPNGYAALQDRTVDFEYARYRALANSPELSNVLLIGFMGRDLEGNDNDPIAGIVESYLVNEGFEPVPDGINDARFSDVTAALNMMPVDYNGYADRLLQVSILPLENTDLYGMIETCMNNIQSASQVLVNFIDENIGNNAQTTPPTLLEAAENGQNAGHVDAVLALYDADRLLVAGDRAVIDWTTMLLLQSEQQAANRFSTDARQFTNYQLETNTGLAKAKTWISTIGALGVFVGGAFKGDPGTAAGGATAYILGVMELMGQYGAIQKPETPEQQIFAQTVAIRQQLADMEADMHQRFDNIEVQLDAIYTAVSTGFNALGSMISEIAVDVDALTLDMAVQRAQLDRIEDALWGLAQDLLDADLQTLTNELLDYRDDEQVDLPYAQGSPSFVSGLSDLFGKATTTAKNNTFAGDQPSNPMFENAAEELGGASIGRNINDLRTYPEEIDDHPRISGLFNLSVLPGGRVVASAPWAQAASAYAQMIRESPWYFAFRYQGELNQQMMDPLEVPELDQIIDEGETLASMMAAGRNQDLFDALFAGYDGNRQAINTYETNVIANVGDLGSCANPPFTLQMDPFTQFVQPGLAQQLTNVIGRVPNLANIGDNSVGTFEMPNTPSNTPDGWAIFNNGSDNHGRDLSHVAETIMALTYSKWRCNGSGPFTPQFAMSVHPFGTAANEMQILLFCTETVTIGGQNFSVGIVRRLFMRVFRNGDPVNIDSESDAESLFLDDLILWRRVRDGVNKVEDDYLTNGINLAGKVIEVPNSIGELMRFEIFSDITNDNVDDEIAWIDELRTEVWTTLRDAAFIAGPNGRQEELYDWVALLDAYATMSLPHLMDENGTLRSALRGAPGPDSLALRVDLVDHYNNNANDLDNATFIESRFENRWMLAQNAVNAGLMTPATGHGYIDWMIAELSEIRESAFKLAIDDHYITDGTSLINGSCGGLEVSAVNGLLKNDVQQEFRLVEVDVASVTQPANGSVTVNADGSFCYSPNHGTLHDSFTYVARSFITTVQVQPGVFEDRYAYSDPATVTIEVRPDLLMSIAVPSECPTIQQAINLIESNLFSFITVAPGTYVENLDSLGKSFWLRSSGGPGVTMIQGTGGPVITLNGGSASDTVTIEGFCITGGTPGADPLLSGAIMHDSSGQLILNDCHISNNTTTGVFASHGSINATDCIFENNTSIQGGAMNLANAGPGVLNSTIASCQFIGNAAAASASESVSGTGGAIRATDTQLLVAGCTFEGNASQGDGGAIYSVFSGGLSVTDSIFTNNSATTEPGFDMADGGAIYINPTSFENYAFIRNSLFDGNSASRYGGAITNFNRDPTASICTFVNNSAGSQGDAIRHGSTVSPGTFTVVDCIVWGSPDFNPELGGTTLLGGNAPYDVTYSAVQNGFTGTGNIGSGVLFVAPDDYRLAAGSAGIDAGINSGAMGGLGTDLDGNPRFVDDPDTVDTGVGPPPIVDMGAYEFQPPSTNCPGDANGDNEVNILDLNVILGNFQSTGAPGIPGDVNNDGVVNILDLNSVLGNFQQNCL